MPRSATLLRINPEVVEKVVRIFESEGEEFPYEDDLALYVKKYEKKDRYALGHVIIDVEEEIPVRKRVNGEVKTELQRVLKCEEVTFACFPKISGSGEITHAVVVLGRERLAKLLSTVVEKIVGTTAYLSVRFAFTPSNENAIRNQFDDIVRIRGEDVVDAVISGITIKGARLYRASPEYQKALSGEVKYIGVALGDYWFIVNSSGRITTYKKLSDEEFIEKIEQIVSRLLRVGAVIL